MGLEYDFGQADLETGLKLIQLPKQYLEQKYVCRWCRWWYDQNCGPGCRY